MRNFFLIDVKPIIGVALSKLLNDHYKDIQLTDFSLRSKGEMSSETKANLIILGVYENSLNTKSSSIERLQKSFPTVPIVVFDQKGDYGSIVKYLRNGVSGFLSLDDSGTDFINCVEQVLAGKRFVNQNLLDLLMDQLIPSGQTKEVDQVLSKRELEVAGYLSKGLRVSAISQMLELSISTVSTIKRSIFNKLDVNNIIQLKEKARL